MNQPNQFTIPNYSGIVFTFIKAINLDQDKARKYFEGLLDDGLDGLAYAIYYGVYNKNVIPVFYQGETLDQGERLVAMETLLKWSIGGNQLSNKMQTMFGKYTNQAPEALIQKFTYIVDTNSKMDLKS